MLEVKGLAKTIDGRAVLTDVSLTLKPGVTVLLGPNGAGKTTLLRILAGVAAADAGSIAWRGRSVTGDSRRYHSQLGYLPQDFNFAPGQTARSFLHYMSGLKGLSPLERSRRVPALLLLAGLDQDADRPLAELSGGQRRLVGLAQALLARPRLLLLDEPTVGLDPEERQRILTLLGTLGRDRAVLISTHIASDAETLGDGLLVLKAGRIVWSGRAETLIAHANGQVWEVTAPVGAAGIDGLMASGRVSQVAVGAGLIRLRCVGQRPAGYVAQAIRPTLEDAYLLQFAGTERATGE
ncbi:MAG: ATP-binding cassette domain-containing protein [Chloroflexota bacterium]